MNGKQSKLKLPDGEADVYVTHPSDSGPWPGVLFFMDALGWRPTMFEMADRLAASGYVVFLPNVFWRAGAPEVFDAKTAFADPKLRERIMALIGQTGPVAMKDTQVYLDALAAMPEVKDKNRLATNGYCMGGGFALLAAVTYPDRIAAAASFHGGGFQTMPEAPAAIAQKLKARVYLGVAETDQRHTPEVTRQLKAAFEQAKVPHQIETLPGMQHGYAVTDHAVYNRDAAEKHWERLVGLLGETHGG
jgi:carboxymethylenebutenolidase